MSDYDWTPEELSSLNRISGRRREHEARMQAIIDDTREKIRAAFKGCPRFVAKLNEQKQ